MNGVGRDDGGGTVLAAGLAWVLLMLVLAVVALGQAAVAAGKAATAADLSALAAADAARGLTPGEPCDIAANLAQRHGARLVACEVGGTGLDTVQVEVVLPSGLPWPAHGMARAGPPPD